MTEFEIVSLVIAAASAVATFASAAAAIVAAIGIWHGIRAMIRANDERGQQHREALKQQREADDKRHTEAMAALNELIQAGQRQGAALERQGIALERQGIALERQGAALDELLRRTAPAPGPAE